MRNGHLVYVGGGDPHFLARVVREDQVAAVLAELEARDHPAVVGRHHRRAEGLVDVAIRVENVLQQPLRAALPHAVELRAHLAAHVGDAMAIRTGLGEDGPARIDRGRRLRMVGGHAGDHLTDHIVGRRQVAGEFRNPLVDLGRPGGLQPAHDRFVLQEPGRSLPGGHAIEEQLGARLRRGKRDREGLLQGRGRGDDRRGEGVAGLPRVGRAELAGDGLPQGHRLGPAAGDRRQHRNRPLVVDRRRRGGGRGPDINRQLRIPQNAERLPGKRRQSQLLGHLERERDDAGGRDRAAA